MDRAAALMSGQPTCFGACGRGTRAVHGVWTFPLRFDDGAQHRPVPVFAAAVLKRRQNYETEGVDVAFSRMRAFDWFRNVNFI